MQWDDDPKGLAKRIEAVLGTLMRHQGASCSRCQALLCAHRVLLSLAAGYQDAPKCPRCLADALGKPEDALTGNLVAYVSSKDCLAVGWRWANAREGIQGNSPACIPSLRGDGALSVSNPTDASVAADLEWDAGDMACGDLLLKLRVRIESMPPGQTLKLIARDSGAPEDLPAWCRLTGHALVRFEHPVYWIRKKE